MITRSEKLQQKIDLLMADIPDLPKGFEDWIKKSAFKNNRYIFYKKIGSKIHGLCSHCESSLIVKNAKHNEFGRCSSCKSKIMYKAINKASRYEDDVIVSIMQKMKDELYVIRYFKATIQFKNHNDDTSNFPNCAIKKLIHPDFSYYEGSREVLKIQKNGKTSWQEYEKLWHCGRKRIEWRNERRRSGMFNKELLRDSKPFAYRKNLKLLFKNTKWKYCGLEYLKQKEINISNYLYTYEEYNVIEILSKLNYTSLVNEIIHKCVYWHGIGGVINMHQMRFGLSKSTFNTALRLDLNTSGIELLIALEETERKLKDEQIMWAIKNTNTETFVQLLRWISPQKLINYVEKNGKADMKHFVTTWKDYLQQCEILNLDLKDSIVLFPKKLFKKHDEYTDLIQSKIDKEISKGIKRQYKKYNDLLSFEQGNLEIKVAKSHKMIIEEGKALGHCVGKMGYSKRMSEGGNLILLLRKNKRPYYTIEFDVEKMKVIQNRGFKNEKANKEVEKFVSKWKVKKLLNLNRITPNAM